MQLLRYLQHWLTGRGPRLQVADFVPETHPIRQWAETFPWALLVAAIDRSFAQRFPKPVDHMCPLKLLPLNYHYLLPRWWSLGVQWAGVSSRVADLTRRADGASSDLCPSA